MITETYEQKRKQIILLYERYTEIYNSLVNPPDEIKRYFKSLIPIAQSVKNNKIKLMIAGEAKSGKSSFINAFLGKNILPMDNLQCTSAIIEIHYHDSCELTAKYADDMHETYKTEAAIISFLKEHAMIDDKYRNIPTTYINNELLIPSKGNPYRSQIEDFIKGVEKDKPLSISSDEYVSLIKAYIYLKKSSWNKIVKSIEIGWPIDLRLKDIILIDSPGIGAQGMVGKASIEFIKEANAVIFVKSLLGQALDSCSFNSFIETEGMRKHKNTLFMILSGAAAKPQEAVYQMHDEAIRLFGSRVNKDCIICVDSIVQMVANDCREKNSEEISGYLKERAKTDNILKASLYDWREEANESKNKFLLMMEQKSNFISVKNVLEQFAYKAPNIILTDFVNKLLTANLNIRKCYEKENELLEVKEHDPEKFQATIKKIIDELQDTENRMGKTVKEIKRKYCDLNGVIDGNFNKSFCDALEKLQKAKKISEMETVAYDKLEEKDEYKKILIEQLLSECNEKLRESINSIPYTSVEPNFTQEDMESIKDNANNDATEMIERKRCWGDIDHVPRFSQNKFHNSIKKYILASINKISATTKDNLYDYTDLILMEYKAKLQKNIDTKTDELNKLSEEKMEAEENKKRISENKRITERAKELSVLLQQAGGFEDGAF